MFTFSVTHNNTLCVSLRANKFIECISFEQFFCFVSFFLSSLHPCLLACNFTTMVAALWCFFLHQLAAGVWIALPVNDTTKNSHPLVKTLLHGVSSGLKHYRSPLRAISHEKHFLPYLTHAFHSSLSLTQVLQYFVSICGWWICCSSYQHCDLCL